MDNSKITLLLFTINEIEGSKHILPRINRNWIDEIIVVDDRSTDGTVEFYKKNDIKVLQQTGKGSFNAQIEGIEAAKGDIIICFSPDNNSIPETIPKLIEKMRDGYDMVVASRYKDDAVSEDDDMMTAFGNWMFTKFVNIFFGANYTDSLVMYRAFKKELIENLPIEIRPYPVFEYQMSIRCAVKNKRVLDIPSDEPERIGGIRKMRPIYAGLSLLLELFRNLFLWKR